MSTPPGTPSIPPLPCPGEDAPAMDRRVDRGRAPHPLSSAGYPRVSVVIPCFNLGRWLDEAVESVLRQTVQETEIVVVDDGSTDAQTVRLLSGYRKPRTTVLRGPNRGLPAARNLGIARARAPLVMCLDADDIIEPTCIERAARTLDEEPTVSIASFWLRAFGDDAWDYTPAECTLRDILVENKICCCAMFRRSMWEEIAGYDEAFTRGYEDWEFWIRALGRGHRVRIIPEILFRYRIREGSMRKGSDRPENRAPIMRALIEKHAELFRQNVLPALIGRERIVGELKDFARQQDEAKRWFLSRDLEHQRRIAQLEEDGQRLAGEARDLRERIARRKEELSAQEERLSRLRETLDRREHEFRAIVGSKAWKLGCAFREAKRSPRAALLLPLRLADFACPDCIKRFVGKMLLIPPGEPVRKGWYLFPHRFFDRALPPSVKARFPTWPRNAARAVFRTTDERLFRQKRWDGPLVTVVIPCYNYGRFIDEAIKSVRAQTFSNHEIIIVDDGSTDPFTVQKLAEVERRALPGVRLIRQTNAGVSAARNRAIEKARGKYICCLDADDLLDPSYLEKCLLVLESRNLDLCYSHVRIFGDETGSWETGAFDLARLLRENCVCTAAVFTRKIWRKAGGFKAVMSRGWEDWDFWIAVAAAGGRGGVLPEQLFLYRRHGETRDVVAAARHADALWTQIRANHKALYESRVKSPRKRNLVVQDPFVNLWGGLSSPSEEDRSRGVLFLIPWMVLGGAESILCGIAGALRKAGGARVHIVATDRPLLSMGDSSDEFRRITPHLYRLPDLLPERLWYDYLESYIRHRAIDTLFVCGCRFIYPHLARLKARFPKLRVVDQIFNDSPMGHVENNRKYVRWIDLTFIVAEKLRRSILSRFGGDPARLRTLYHGANTALFDPARIDKAEARAQFDLPSDKKIILYVGRLSVEKNPLLFVELAAALREDRNLRFVMAGDGPLRDETVARVRKLHLDNLLLFGIVPPKEMPALTRASDLLVVTSLTEGVPLTIFEALAMNVPVVASDVGGISDVVREGVHGFLFRDGDLAGCVDKVRRALGHRFGDLRTEAVGRYELRDVYARYCEILQDTATPPVRALPLSAARRSPLSFRRAARLLFRPADRRNARQEKVDGPLVSVVIPCHNYGRFIDEALGSVLAQTFSDYEVLIVDDGSTDPATLEKLREIEARNLPRVTIIRQENQRLPRTRNNGIRASRGTYICCLDADDLIEPTYLQKCVTALENGGLDICYSHVRLFGDEERVWETGDFDPETLKRQNCVCVGAVYRKSAWEQAGGYNPDMSLGYEDWDFWLSMLENGAQGTVIPEPLFLYRKHGRSMIDGAQERHKFLCAQIRENHPALFAGKVFPRGTRRRSARRRTFPR